MGKLKIIATALKKLVTAATFVRGKKTGHVILIDRKRRPVIPAYIITAQDGKPIEQSNRSDIRFQAGYAERENRFWRVRHGIELVGCLVNADIRCLR